MSMPTRRRGRGMIAAVVAVAASAVAVAAVDPLVDQEAERAFFDLSEWTEDEKDELRNRALAIRDLGRDIDWRRPSAAVEADADDGGRRRLLSEEDFIRAAEDEWDADFRRANGGRGRNAVAVAAAAAGEGRGSVRRVPGKVAMPEREPKKVSMRNFFRPRADFRCIDDSPSNKVPCPPDDLGSACDKYNGGGSFLRCFDYCMPSFCCIHDSVGTYSPTCARTEPNCPSYFACYIVWWKLHDTIGPANYLRIVQNEPFYDASFDNILSELTKPENAEFFAQLFGHHFDEDEAPTDDIFEDREYW